ncbi:MAG TPA: translocation/assembly module TamB domain-containing protein, partial [Gemmatimonadaceae bacterium]|nr:translocation/assembly module TamB domain-containing protein [Gemmatimonadaceae bacterium]
SAFNLAFGANEFAVFNNPTLARIDIQTAQDRSTSRLPRDAAMARFGGIQLQGPLDSARLTGNVIIQNSVMFLPDTKIASKTLGEESAPSDTAASAEPAWIVRLFNGLRLHGDSVTLGQNVSLKTLPDDPQQANVKLTGTLSVVPVPSQFGSAEGRAGGLSGRLAPQGVLQAVQGGQYTLDLGLVRRTFTVEPGSTISFDGTSIIPTLDIQMEYDSRLYGRPDITIVNTLKGPLVPGPKDSLSSPNAGYAASQSDLVSYLLIGGPGFDLGQNPSVAATLGAIFGPSLNPYFSGTLGRFLGPISFTGASSDVTQRYGTTDPFKDYIIGGRLSYESHVTSNVYVSLSSGLCTLGGTQQGQSAVDQFSQGLGAQLEYRFSTMSRLQAGTEPSTQAQLCSPSLSNLPGLAPTPRQYSFSFGYTWRW